ncbi:MAG: hypothetical protein EP350_05430 [Alphaproteobacteria bacterium]|nr:MAG: hypothetical protein EP350_05430 [Alphaproteobacteria bacterium]
MSIHFAAARVAARSPVAQILAFRRAGPAANDNGEQGGSQANEAAMRAALYHFAKYGLGAAREARKSAEAAFFAGNRAEYDHWLEICRVLDRRMALHFEQSVQA